MTDGRGTLSGNDKINHILKVVLIASHFILRVTEEQERVQKKTFVNWINSWLLKVRTYKLSYKRYVENIILIGVPACQAAPCKERMRKFVRIPFRIPSLPSVNRAGAANCSIMSQRWLVMNYTSSAVFVCSSAQLLLCSGSLTSRANEIKQNAPARHRVLCDFVVVVVVACQTVVAVEQFILAAKFDVIARR